MNYVPLCCMSGNVYAFIPLYHDKYRIALAYPCMLCLFLLCFLSCDDHLLVGAEEREVRDGPGRRSSAA